VVHGVVEVRGGRVRGVERNGTWSFSGVPYAASPAGRRRWRPPGPVEPWSGIRECDRFGSVAHQTPMEIEAFMGGEPEAGSEDCLSLNIWTPGVDGGHRPVMVWVHGGSFVSGSGSGGMYRGGRLAREGDVVVVTINYRLGLLGFLAHPVFEDPDQTWLDGERWSGFGNWGLADQIAALCWVRDNIAAFGGDAGKVTLFGESAGGMSVSALLGASAAKGLFHRAIVQSGPPYTHSAEAASSQVEKVTAHLGVALTRASLEEVPAEELVRALDELGRQGEIADSGLPVMPVIDGGLLDRPPEEGVASGSASTVPLLIGTTRDEFSLWTVGSPKLSSLDEDGLRRRMRRVTPDAAAADEVIAAVREARAGRGEPVAPRDLWTAVATEFVFRVPTIRFADVHARAAEPGVGTFCYLFTWESPAFGGRLGSCHALEIPFVFGSVLNPLVQTFSGGGDDAFALSAAMRAAWVAFARSGTPEGDGAAPGGTWSNWDPARRPTTVLGPCPGRHGLWNQVERPRDEELDAVAAAAVPWSIR